MDLRLWLSVLWRFRILVACGVLLAFALAAFSYVTVSFNDGFTIKYRKPEQWVSTATLLVTQPGFPEGRTATIQSAGTNFTGLAALYSTLVDSDGVRALVVDNRPPLGQVSATTVMTSDGDPLPLIRIDAVSLSPEPARRLASLYSNALIDFILSQQDANRIPPRDRVQVAIVKEPRRGVLLAPRSKTTPIAIFLSVLVVTIALAFALENLRPRRRGGSEVLVQSRKAA